MSFGVYQSEFLASEKQADENGNRKKNSHHDCADEEDLLKTPTSMSARTHISGAES